MKKILVPCDFSAPSLEAVRFAANIAKQTRGEITLLHTVSIPSINTSLVLGFEADYKAGVKKAALASMQKIKTRYASVKIRECVEFGDLLTEVRKATKSGKYELVIMGTQGASGVKEYTIGSNTEKIVRNSIVPVISVRKAPSQIKNIVFPVQPDLDQEELTMRVKALQNFFGAKLHVVFVNTPGSFQTDNVSLPQLEKFAKRFMLKNYTLSVFADTSEEEGIMNFAKAVKADMVAMRTHGRKGLAHLATSSIAEDVVNHTTLPTWTFKIK